MAEKVTIGQTFLRVLQYLSAKDKNLSYYCFYHKDKRAKGMKL